MKNNTYKLIKRYIFWAISIALMVFIFLNSHETATESTKTSASLIEQILTIFMPKFVSWPIEQKELLIKSLQFIVRKGAHFSVYLVLGASCFGALNTYSIKMRNKCTLALLISFVYAISDEIHQLFIEGRSGQVSDVILDLSGAVTGVLITLAIICVYKRIKKNVKGGPL